MARFQRPQQPRSRFQRAAAADKAAIGRSPSEGADRPPREPKTYANETEAILDAVRAAYFQHMRD